MKYITKIISTLLLSMMVVSSVNATLFTVELDQTDLTVGQTLTANLLISDIEKNSTGFTSLIASFNLEFMFDNSLLSFNSISFNNKLSDGFDSFQMSSITAPGALNIEELTFLSGGDLFSLQNGLSQFVLASINFDIIGAGSSLFDLDIFDVSDDGYDYLIDLNSQVTHFTTTAGSAAIPEPSSIALILVGLMLVQVRRLIK